jgi:hypothetical protein
MQTVWITKAAVRMEPGDMPSGDVLGFMKITLWASSEVQFLERVRAYLEKYRWELLSTEEALQVDSNRDYGDEVNKMVDETLEDENFVRLGTYFSYKPE